MATVLEAMKNRVRSTGKLGKRDALALIAAVEAVQAKGHPIGCKGCRAVLEEAKPLLRSMLRSAADIGAVGGVR